MVALESEVLRKIAIMYIIFNNDALCSQVRYLCLSPSLVDFNFEYHQIASAGAGIQQLPCECGEICLQYDV